MSNFIDNFMGGMAFGMLANNPFFGGCFGFGMYPMYGGCNFGGFINPFPNIFGNTGYMMNAGAQIPPTTFSNPIFPSVDFSPVQSIWDYYTNPDSEYYKQIGEMNKKMDEQAKKNNNNQNSRQYIPQIEFPFSSFYMPSSVAVNPWVTGYMGMNWFNTSQKPASSKTERSEKAAETDDDKSDAKNGTTNLTKEISDKRFNKFLTIILKREGGYSNNKNDRGGETNKGITHTTYDTYRKSKGLPTRSVKEMTDDEMREIYYDMFYVESGADKISDKKLALHVFDVAVNMGPGTAKKLLKSSGGDKTKFEKLRKNRYNEIIANDKSQKANEKGWNNRMIAIRDAADKELDTIA